MALSDDLYEPATRVRRAEHTAPILQWRGEFEWHQPVARIRADGPTRTRAATRELSDDRRWRLAVGISWIVVAVGALQIDAGSIMALVGLMFAVAAVQTFVMPAAQGVSATFGAVFVVAEIFCFISPTDTVAATADMLGFLFAIVGAWWMIEAALERGRNPLWWIGSVAGVVMAGLAFWTAGRSDTTDAYPLLVCTGLWALMQSIIQITRAFAIRPERGES